MKHNLLFLLLAAILISGCRKEINMDIPDNERKLVVNGVFNIGEPMVLTVSKSKNMLEKSKIEDVSNAEIKLFENGVFVTNLDTVSRLWSVEYKWDQTSSWMDSIFRTTYVSKNLTITADKKYKIEVSVPGIDSKAFVEIKIPSLVPIVKIDTATVKTDQNNQMLQFDMLIDDPPQADNFYLINLQSKILSTRDPKDPYYSGEIKTPVYIETDDVLINNNNFSVENGLIFNDELFNGKLQNIKFKTQLMWVDTTNYQVLLRSITEEYYDYLVTSSLFNSNVGNPIAEPVSVKSNVKDGFGIVTAVSQSVDSSIVYIGGAYFYPGK